MLFLNRFKLLIVPATCFWREGVFISGRNIPKSRNAGSESMHVVSISQCRKLNSFPSCYKDLPSHQPCMRVVVSLHLCQNAKIIVHFNHFHECVVQFYCDSTFIFLLKSEVEQLFKYLLAFLVACVFCPFQFAHIVLSSFSY